MNELSKKFVIKTDIGYFCKEEVLLVTNDVTKATLMDNARVKVYFTSICSDIALVNKKEIKGDVIPYGGFRFEIGKYYENTDKLKIHILGMHHTKVYGKCLLAETNANDVIPFIPLGLTEESTLGFNEITQIEWDSSFKVAEEV